MGDLMLRRRFLKLAALAGFPAGDVRLGVAEETACDKPPSPHLTGGSPYRPRRCSSIWCSSLDSFVRVPSNAPAYDTILRATSDMAFFRANSPITLYGPATGVGTTHLLAAAANELSLMRPRTAVLSAEQLMADFIRSLESNYIQRFREFYSNVDALFIDDIVFLSGREHIQQELAWCIQRLLDNSGMLALTFPILPCDMDWRSDNLRRIILGGFQAPIMHPSYSESVEILRRVLQEWGETLPDEAIFLAANKGYANIRESGGVLRKILADSHYSGEPVTVDFLHSIERRL